MNSQYSKTLHLVGNFTLLEHIIHNAKPLSLKSLSIVISKPFLKELERFSTLKDIIDKYNIKLIIQENINEYINDSLILESQNINRERVGVTIGSGIGGLPSIQENVITMQEKGPRRVSPFFVPASLINLISGHVSIKYEFTGPNDSAVTACATGAHAIINSARTIKLGEADVMIAGGAESALCR
ncbi:3-oxoacyl-(acyl-carrier-protein) synthase II, partial [Wolbachia endosymbiont of Drosophila ananassae]